MEDIVSPHVFYGLRQPELCQYLAPPPMNGGDYLKRGTVDDPHPDARRVNAAWLQFGLPHLCLKLLKINFGRCRFMTPNRATVAMDDLLVGILAVNFVINLLVFARQQR